MAMILGMKLYKVLVDWALANEKILKNQSNKDVAALANSELKSHLPKGLKLTHRHVDRIRQEYPELVRLSADAVLDQAVEWLKQQPQKEQESASPATLSRRFSKELQIPSSRQTIYRARLKLGIIRTRSQAQKRERLETAAPSHQFETILQKIDELKGLLPRASTTKERWEILLQKIDSTDYSAGLYLPLDLTYSTVKRVFSSYSSRQEAITELEAVVHFLQVVDSAYLVKSFRLHDMGDDIWRVVFSSTNISDRDGILSLNEWAVFIARQ